MALGFNNSPVNWDQSSTLLSSRVGQNLGRGIESIANSIKEYAEKKKEKQEEEQAATVLADYMKQAGMDPSLWTDKGNLRAAVKKHGAGTVLQMGEMMRQRGEQEEDRKRMAAAFSLYAQGVKSGASHEDAMAAAGNAYMGQDGRNPEAFMEYMGKVGDAKYRTGREKADKERLEMERKRLDIEGKNSELQRNLSMFRTTMDAAAQPTELRYKEELAKTMAENRATSKDSRALMNEERRARIERIKALTAATEAKGGSRDITAGIMAKYEAGDDAGALADFRKAAGSDMTMDDLEAFLQERASRSPTKDGPGANRDDGKITAPGGFTIRVK